MALHCNLSQMLWLTLIILYLEVDRICLLMKQEMVHEVLLITLEAQNFANPRGVITTFNFGLFTHYNNIPFIKNNIFGIYQS